MARKSRIHFEGAIYHVVCRGNNKSYVFESNAEKEKYLSIIQRYKEKFNFKLHAYCIMSNHVHLLIGIEEVPLNKIMQGIQQVYTYYYNKKHSRSGHVFQQRYNSTICLDHLYLTNLLRYIHQNPVRANIPSGINYEYSSHNVYAGIRENSIVDQDFIIKLYGNSLENQRNEYMTKIKNTLNREELDALARENIIGYEEKNHNCIMKLKKEKMVPIETILDNVCKKHMISTELIIEQSRSRNIVAARKICIILIKKYCDISVKEIAHRFKLADSTVSNILSDYNAKKMADFFESINK